MNNEVSRLTAVAFVRLVRAFERLIASTVQWDTFFCCQTLELVLLAWTWLANTMERTVLTRAAYNNTQRQNPGKSGALGGLI